MEKMTIDDALKFIDQVLAAYKGSRQEHVTLINAINTLKENLRTPEVEVVKPAKVSKQSQPTP